jgi:hypothetical protein
MNQIRIQFEKLAHDKRARNQVGMGYGKIRRLNNYLSIEQNIQIYHPRTPLHRVFFSSKLRFGEFKPGQQFDRI